MSEPSEKPKRSRSLRYLEHIADTVRALFDLLGEFARSLNSWGPLVVANTTQTRENTHRLISEAQVARLQSELIQQALLEVMEHVVDRSDPRKVAAVASLRERIASISAEGV